MTTGASKPRLPAVVPSDVSAALDKLGIDHKVRGGEAIAVCPNPDHADRSPSWSCNLETGMHHCFSCGWGGTFARLVAITRGVRYDDAEGWIKEHKARSIILDVLADDQTEPAYVPLRAVSEADLWQCTPPPAGELAARMVSPEAAAELEILWDGKGWVFPIRDAATSRLIGWQLKRAKFVRNRPVDLDRSSSLFGLDLVRSTGVNGPVIVTESPLNAGRFLTAGFPRVVATYGIEFTDAQIDVLWRVADEIVFAQDNDLPGQRKIARWLADHPEHTRRCRVFDYGGVFEDYLLRCIHPAGDGRDPGNLTDAELRRGIEYATPAWRTYFEGVNWWL